MANHSGHTSKTFRIEVIFMAIFVGLAIFTVCYLFGTHYKPDFETLQAFCEEMHPNNKLQHQYADQSGIESVDDMGIQQDEDTVKLYFGNYKMKFNKDELLTEEWIQQLKTAGVTIRARNATNDKGEEYTHLTFFFLGEPIQEFVD